jgi:hypothetical protein
VLLAGAIVGVVVVLAAAAIYLQGRPPTVTVGAQAVEVRSFFYGGKWRLDSLTQVALETALPQVLRRTNGYALGSTLRGHFRLEGLGAAQLYIEADRPPFIVLRCGDDLLLLNHPDEQQTRALFAAIRGAWTRARGAK